MKQRLQYIGLFIFILCVFNCSNSKSDRIKMQKKENDISLKFINVPPTNNSLKIGTNKFAILNSPYISYRSHNSFFPEKINSNDTAFISIREDTIYLTLRYKFYESETFLFYRGDSVIIDYAKEDPVIRVLNRTPKKYDYKLIEVFKMLNGYLDNATFMKFNQKFRRKEELIEYENKIKESKNHATYLLDSLESKNLISENIYLYKKKELFYHKKKYSEINFSIKDSNDLHIDTYRGMLLNYTKSFVEPKNIKTSSGYIFNSKRAFDFVIKSDLFNQKSKEFLLWTYLKEIGNNFSKEDFLNYYQLFTEEVNDVKIVDDIKNQFLISLNSVNKKPYEVLLIDNSKVEITLNKIIKKNKEKVIYIDFWASWCTPCRSAMPASRKLKTEFKNKDVVFIYVSIDKNFDKWKKASEDEGLSFYKNNILAINYPNANFYKELDLKTIPRYILYDKKGKLVHQNAPGPEGEEIRKLFDKYLEE